MQADLSLCWACTLYCGFLFWLIQFVSLTGENVIELAMYLDLLNSHNFPNWPTVFGIAEKVLQRIYEGDQEFYEHLKIISKIHVKVNPKVCFIMKNKV